MNFAKYKTNRWLLLAILFSLFSVVIWESVAAGDLLNAPKNVANVVDGTASNGGIFRAGAFIDGKVYVGRGGHFDGAVNAGARSIDRATAKGISVFEKNGVVYWANDSISLPRALTSSEMATVREALQAAFPGKDIRQLINISDALK